MSSKDIDDLFQRMYPGEHFSMQCVQVEHELVEQLGVQAFVNVEEKEAFAVVKLNDGFALQLHPACPGYEGYTNWISWRYSPMHRGSGHLKMSQYRCRVELIRIDEHNQIEEVTSFGLDAPSLEALLQRALKKFKLYAR